MCCLAIQVAVYTLLLWVSGGVACVRWVVFVVVVAMHVYVWCNKLCIPVHGVCVCVFVCCS